MKFTIANEVEYIPNIYGNQELDPEDQTVITIDMPTTAQANLLYSVSDGGLNSDTMVAGVARLVKGIRNLEVNGKQITTGKELAACRGMYMLIQNIGAHILGLLADVDKDPT